MPYLKVSGYALMWGGPTRNPLQLRLVDEHPDGHLEEYQRGAFAEQLATQANIKALFNHQYGEDGTSGILTTREAGGLFVEEREQGLFVEVILPFDRFRLAQLTGVMEPQGFSVGYSYDMQDDIVWSRLAGLDHATIRQGILTEISIVAGRCIHPALYTTIQTEEIRIHEARNLMELRAARLTGVPSMALLRKELERMKGDAW